MRTLTNLALYLKTLQISRIHSPGEINIERGAQMTRLKALELNKESFKSLKDGKFQDHADAVALGIEALKRLGLARSYGDKHAMGLLPGEHRE